MFYTTTGNHRFLIERSKDFDKSGNPIDGSGWYASRVVGNDIQGGQWFETEEEAEAACDAWAEKRQRSFR